MMWMTQIAGAFGAPPILGHAPAAIPAPMEAHREG